MCTYVCVLSILSFNFIINHYCIEYFINYNDNVILNCVGFTPKPQPGTDLIDEIAGNVATVFKAVGATLLYLLRRIYMQCL